MEDAMNLEDLESALKGWDLVYLETTTSTNDVAKALAAKGLTRRTVVIADAQTSGRGRRGSSWVSPSGRNGIASIVINPSPGLPPERWTRLTLAAALACCEVLDNIPGLAATAEIKWPNDVYLSGRKVAGILVESLWGTDGGYTIIGTGININLEPKDFPEELRPTATSVWIERGGLATERTAFILHYLAAFENRLDQASQDFDGMRQEAWSRSWLAHRKVRLTSAGREWEGTVIGLGPEGELQLQTEDEGVKTISSADLVRPIGASIR
jgi:BirA family transcriptional regulator, biotin operon repressor / biotin---[acetyl-CoA-carboxylase] ligase